MSLSLTQHVWSFVPNGAVTHDPAYVSVISPFGEVKKKLVSAGTPRGWNSKHMETGRALLKFVKWADFDSHRHHFGLDALDQTTYLEPNA